MSGTLDAIETHPEPVPPPPEPAPGGRASGFWPMAAAAAAVAAVAVVAFAPAVGNGWVDWDDEKNFLENPAFRGLGRSQLAWDWRAYHLGVYQPISWMLLGAQYLACGLDPRGYHAASLAMHAAVAVALFGLVVALLRRSLPDEVGRDRLAVLAGAAAASMIFSAHPLRAEVVAWASCQPYLPCALFAILSVLAYLRAHEPGRSRPVAWLAGSWLLLLAALSSKAPAVGLPAVLLILDIDPLRRLGPGHWLDPPARRAWLEKVPFVALSLMFMAVAVRAKDVGGTLRAPEYASTTSRLAQAGFGATFYAIKTAIPSDLSAYYPLPDRVDLRSWPCGPATAAAAVATLGAILLRRRWPGLLAAWASYLVLLAPNSGLVRIGNQVAADRYSYLASMGFVALLASVLARAFHERPRRVAATAAVAVAGSILVLSSLSWRQARTWHDPEALWSHARAHGGEHSADVLTNLGAILNKRGQYAEATDLLREAIRLEPRHDQALNNLGAALLEQSRYEEAEAPLARSLQLRPGVAEAHFNLGMALAGQGAHDRALAEIARAATLRPDIALTRYHLGRLLARRGRAEEAIPQLSAAVRLDPSLAAAHAQLGEALARLGRDAEAVAPLAEAARLFPRDPANHESLGAALLRLGRPSEAESAFSEAIRLDPESADARHGLGLSLARQGRPSEAESAFSDALRLDPNHVASHLDLGSLLLSSGRRSEAARHFREALRLRPDSPSALRGLSASTEPP